MTDRYKTIYGSSEGLYKEKGSKFLSFAYPVAEEDGTREIIDNLKKKYHDARHHCFAYRIGPKKETIRAFDDNEPSNTAGKPILGQIQSFDLTNILIVVVRYFGGTLLGKGGLINAYKSAAKNAIVHAHIIEHTLHNYYQCTLPYEQISDIERIISDENLQRIEQKFDANYRIVIGIRKNETDRVLQRLGNFNKITTHYLYTK